MTQKKNTIKPLLIMLAVFGIAILIFLNIQQRRQIERLELLPPEVHQKDILHDIDDLRAQNDSLGMLVSKYQESASNLTVQMNQAEKKAQILEQKNQDATKQYKKALKYCKEIKQVDAHSIKELKLIQTNCYEQDDNVDRLMVVHKEFVKRCKKKKRKAFAIGFASGLLVGLLIP